MTMAQLPSSDQPQPARASATTPSTNAAEGSSSQPQIPVPLHATPSADVLVQWLRDMMLIREFEVRSMQAYQNKLAGGFLHVYNGQEAVAVGCVAATQHNDPLVTAYRDHGHALARGMDPKVGMAELFGRIGGCAKGKGGSMHFFDANNHMYGGHGIVGAQTPLGAGLAFATKYNDEVMQERSNSRVTLCFLGDGAINQGAFHEALNLATIFNLPVIFIIENNGYSMGTATVRGTAGACHLKDKAVGYDMASCCIDGMDVLSVWRSMKPLVDQCRAESRPALVDMQCYRFKGHSMSDPRKYRTHDEEQHWEAEDPIGRLARQLVSAGAASKDDLKVLAKSVKTDIREAVEWAKASPEPTKDELYHDVYADEWGPYTGTSLPEFMQRRSSDRNGS